MTRTTLLVALVLLVSACGASRTMSPSPVAGPLVLALSGQSNAGMIRPFLAERASVVGYAAYSTSIAPCWDNVPPHDNAYDGRCWAELKPQLTSALDAFVWWQGDSEIEHPDYTPKLADLVQRVRAAARKPQLLVVVLQLGAVNGDDPDGAGAQAFRWVQQDAHAIYVETRDKEYLPDRQHMTDQGYRDVVARLVVMIRESGEA